MRDTGKFFNEAKGHGSITVGVDQDYFVHVKALHRCGADSLHKGDVVEFDAKPMRNGRTQAVSVRLVK
jgi:cold shock CspA family protein